MARWMSVSLLCLAGVSHAAQGLYYLPATELAIDAISKQAEVLAADERVSAVDAQARALAIGSYELSATVIPQRRRTNTGQSLDEFEVELGRPFRLPGKAPLDR
jgi:outer membrane protein, heavy metal efflux system